MSVNTRVNGARGDIYETVTKRQAVIRMQQSCTLPSLGNNQTDYKGMYAVIYSFQHHSLRSLASQLKTL